MFDYLLDKGQQDLRDEVREFVKSVPRKMILDMDADKIQFPKEFLQEAGKRNLMGCRYPAKWGGRGMDWVSTCMVMEEVGVLGYIFACVFGVGAELVCDAIILHGNEAQKEKYVKPLLKGELFAAECLTEPRGGSDFFGATTRAELKNGYFHIRGQKRFVVGAEGADFFIVYCNTDPDGKPHERISLILIEKERQGVEVKHLYGLMGTRGGGTGRLLFRDVKVPESNLIGELNQGAHIFNTMMVPERLTSAAASLGIARASLEVAARYSDRRTAFGEKIRRYQGVSFKVADAITQLDAARALTIAAGKSVDEGLASARRLVSEAKKFSTDMAWDVCNIAMRVVGGIGYTNIFPIERMVRDARLIQIWTGTNEIMNLLIQHEYYREVIGDPNPGRQIEVDAPEGHLEDEKVYEDDEMWTKGW